MKRFSAPSSLYPSPVVQPPNSTNSAATDPTASGSSHGLGPPPPCSTQHPQQDLSVKRVKTEQTFEALFGAETHCDVVVNVNSDQFVFHAHRVILEMKSDVLARLLAGLAEKQDVGEAVVAGGRRVAVLHVTEEPECSQVFSRFMYFLYSGAVWLHQDYVLPLFRLAHKYNVDSLLAHCEAYILQVLAKTCSAPPLLPASAADTHPANFQGQNHHHHHQSNQPHQPHYNSHHSHHHHHHHSHHPHHSLHHNHSSPPAPTSNFSCPPYAGAGFSLDVVCDLYEDEVFAGDVGQTCFRVLCCQFRRLVRQPRWAKCRVQTACELLASDLCQVEENLVLAAATDYMKQNNLADKKQIESILANIRYPCLNRRLLYQLYRNSSFKNFPGIQELMLNAVRYHCFKDLPEARGDFVGLQFNPRIGAGAAPTRRASVQVAATAVTATPVAGDSYPDPLAFSDSAYSLEADVPVVLTRSRQSQV